MKVIDNFLPSAYQDAIETLMLSTEFPWYLNKTTAPYNPINFETTTECPQFTHKFLVENTIHSNYYNLISLIPYHLMLTENINTTNMIRVKANLNIPVGNYPIHNHYGVHVDVSKEKAYTTCIYYVNDSDGDTILFNNDGSKQMEVTPKKGRLVYFDGNTLHAGCPPKQHNLRCIINFNFKTTE